MVTDLRRSTLAVVAGRNGSVPGAPLQAPPVFASAFRAGGETGYGRDGNPTWVAFERGIGVLEGGHAVAFATGMAAASAVLQTLPHGARVVAGHSCYLEVRRLLAELAAHGRLDVTFTDTSDADAILDAVVDADLVWADALSNPNLEVPELDLIGAACSSTGASLVVDSTLATPLLLRPLEYGARVVLHSATKFIGGHSDLLLGVAVAADESLAEKLREVRTMLGAVPGTMESWLGLRGLRTLAVRIERGTSSAALLAERLATHPQVSVVRYPGLVDDPEHARAARLLDGFGAVLSFELAGGVEQADALCREVALISHATSLGGVETLIERQGRWHAGPDVAPGLVRLSVGCEHPEDLWADLSQALDAI